MSGADRKTFAERQIGYEVRMLVQQVRHLERLNAKRRGRLREDGQALLEAALVHLRLLDEFLGGREKPNALDARATDWLGSWTEQGFSGAIGVGSTRRSRISHGDE